MEDILLDDEGNFVAGAGGDFATVADRDCLLQDIKHLLLTFPGDLWAHKDYGVGVQFYLQAEDQEINRLELQQLIKKQLAKDERIAADSIKVQIQSWSRETIKVQVRFLPAAAAFAEEEEIPAGEAVVILNISQQGISFGGAS